MWRYGVDVEGLVAAQGADLHGFKEFPSPGGHLDVPAASNNLETEMTAMEDGVAEMLCAATKTFLTNIIEVKSERLQTCPYA